MKDSQTTGLAEIATIPVADRLNGVGEYYFATKLRQIDTMNKAGKNVINLGIGSPDLPPHPRVIEKLHAEALKPGTHAYQSYKGCPVLRNAFADWYEKWYGVTLDPEKEILPLIGSKEGIMHICMTYINPGDPVLIPNPGYPTYRSAATIAGATVVEYRLKKENHWRPDFTALQETVDKLKAKTSARWKGCLMFVNYPHMPTGQLPEEGLFDELIGFAARNNILLVHDNPYSFILNEKPVSLLSARDAKNVALELNSLSKSHNMAGWRVGVIAGNEQRISDIMRFKSNMDSGMFLPLQLAAAEALRLDKTWFDELNATYADRRESVFQLLDLLACQYETKQAGMFVWAEIPNAYADSYVLSDEVLEKANVFITPGSIFGDEGSQFIRISLCTKKEKIEEAIQRIKSSTLN